MNASASPQSIMRRMNLQRDTKDWVKAVARHLNLSPSQLATSAGVAASTLTRYLNDVSGQIGISQRTLDAVSQYSGVPLHQLPGERSVGLAEPDTVPYDAANTQAADPVRKSVAAWVEGVNGRNAWLMKGWALDLSGILPGDIIIIDQNQRAKSGDIVCAQLADWQTGRAETVMRLYDAPYIMTHSAKLGAGRPQQVDDDAVAIRGVAVAIIRARN